MVLGKANIPPKPFTDFTMKNTKIVAALAASGHAAMRDGANRQTFPSTMVAQARSPEELPNGREREDECGHRR
jgi:hypothetical protein